MFTLHNNPCKKHENWQNRLDYSILTHSKNNSGGPIDSYLLGTGPASVMSLNVFFCSPAQRITTYIVNHIGSEIVHNVLASFSVQPTFQPCFYFFWKVARFNPFFKVHNVVKGSQACNPATQHCVNHQISTSNNHTNDATPNHHIK